MSTEDPLKNWQLEDRKQPDPEQWKLEDADQDLSKHLQLQEGETSPYWQPVEYERAPQARRNWVLPSVLIVALLAVLGYVGWIAFNQLGGGLGSLGGAATAPTETPVQDAAAAAAAASPTAAPAAPTAEPTATSAPAETPTPTLEPTPAIAMGELISGTVNAVQGVNARREPDGEIIRTLNENEGVVVTRQDGDWLQVILSDGATVAWVSSEFIDRNPQLVPLEQLAAIFTAAGLPAPTPVAAPSAPSAAESVTGTLGLSGTAPISAGESLTSALSLGGTAPQLALNGVIPTAPFTNALPAVGPALTVSDTTGVNARSTAGTDGAVILVVPNGAVLPVIGRNAAGDWLQVRLPDGQEAWMFGEAVIATSDAASSAPVVAGTDTGAATGTLTGTLTETLAATNTTGAPAVTVPPVAGAPTGASATIASPLGANLRGAPSRDLEPIYSAASGESFAVIGRNGAGDWIQVVLPDGSAAWVLAAVAQVSVGVDTLPVTQP
ncbi:MAG: SH3 domain-containing protein [Caldilineaceae bacterium]